MDDNHVALPLPFSLATQFVDELIENRESRIGIAGALAYAVSVADHRTEPPLVLYAVVRGVLDGCIDDQTIREPEDKFGLSKEECVRRLVLNQPLNRVL